MLTCARPAGLQSLREQPIVPGNDAVVDLLRERGLVMVGGLCSQEAVLSFSRRFMTLVQHRDSGPDGLTVIQDIGERAQLPGLAGLGCGDLAAHTEGSSMGEPPRLLLLVCLEQPDSGGEVVLTDGRDVHAFLSRRYPEAVELMSRPGVAYYGDGGGRPSRIFTHHPGGRISVRFRQDALAQFNPVVQHCLPRLREAIEASQRVVALSPGQGYLLDNYRYLHGRRAFRGTRVCLRALGIPRFALRPGFDACADRRNR
ncbi:TauD/TfdA family dioxygenase [Streptomyces sp. NPDC058195]|uniref:TauD/TfdA family dioxygenase n=1 Tax=Streptomyces sp. NPDC058195 TaxID=3346375 RepID=UPI0036E0B91E